MSIIDDLQHEIDRKNKALNVAAADIAILIEEKRRLKELYDSACEISEQRRQEIEQLHGWVNDLQSGMYINCVYCGHRYGPKESTPVSMAEVLKEHIEQCPKHPMSVLKKANEELRARIAELEALPGRPAGLDEALNSGDGIYRP